MLEPIESGAKWSHVIECELCPTTCTVDFSHLVHDLFGSSLEAQIPTGWGFFKEGPGRTAIMCPECSIAQRALAKGQGNDQG